MTKRPTKTFVTHGVVAFVNSPLCEHARKKEGEKKKEKKGIHFLRKKRKKGNEFNHKV